MVAVLSARSYFGKSQITRDSRLELKIASGMTQNPLDSDTTSDYMIQSGHRDLPLDVRFLQTFL